MKRRKLNDLAADEFDEIDALERDERVEGMDIPSDSMVLERAVFQFKMRCPNCNECWTSNIRAKSA
jgi:hypothetical protein